MLTSLTNARVRRAVKLRNRRQRDLEQRFLVEGQREMELAFAAGVGLEEVFHCESMFSEDSEPAGVPGGERPEQAGERSAGPHARQLKPEDLVDQLATAGVPCQGTSDDVFRKLSYRHTPDGLLAVAHTPGTGLSELTVPAEALWLVVAGIEKPGNLGAMLRTADAAGVAGVLVADPATDPFNPNVVRASLGTLFTVPLAVATGGAVRAWLADHGIRSVATSPSAERTIWSADLRGAVACIIGSEHSGLDADWLRSSVAARIPMAGAADSLNAATTAALTLFEARRQRGHGARR